MGDIQHATRKGDNMRHDETRDNTTAIEAVMIAGDSAEEILVELGHSPENADRMVNGDTDDDTPEDDGQPSEYTEWQDYMGGDEYYDHSENSMW
jgi:hypothetical protein